MMLKRLLTCMVVVLLVSPVIADVDRIQIETALSEKAQQSLDAIYGPNNFVVHVNVVLSQPQYRVEYTKQSDPELNTKKGAEEKIQILPGYPVIKNLGSDFKQLPFDSVTTYIQPRIRRLLLDVTVNKAMSRGTAGRAIAMVKTQIGFRENRDRATIQYRDFYKTPAPGTQKMSVIPGASEPLYTVQNLFFLLLLLMLMIFMLLYLRAQRLARAVAGERSGSGGEGANVSVNPNIKVPRGGGGGSSTLKMSKGDAIKQYFDFVTPDNLDKLLYIIKNQKIGSDNIAVMTSFMDPELAADVLSELDLDQRSSISVGMLQQKMINRGVLDKFEAQIKQAMETLAGGETVFQNVFSSVSNRGKKEIMGVLSQNNHAGYKVFRNNVVLFDDIKFLNDDEIKFVLSSVDLDIVSRALVHAESEVYDRIFQNLTGSARDIVKQFLDLKAASVGESDSETAQDAMLAKIGELEKEGRIDLKGKVQVSDVEPAVEAAETTPEGEGA